MPLINGVPSPDEGAPPLSKAEQEANLRKLREQEAAKKKAKSATAGTKYQEDFYSETYAMGGKVRMRDGIAVRGKTRGKIY